MSEGERTGAGKTERKAEKGEEGIAMLSRRVWEGGGGEKWPLVIAIEEWEQSQPGED